MLGLLASDGGEGRAVRCIYENWRAYRDEQYQWFRVAKHTNESIASGAAAR